MSSGPTHENTVWDVARFEVCAHRWADLGEPGYGVALLNDCKYGYDIHGNVMRLSLLRSPGWPDPEGDRGLHRFTYALFPHAGDLREAGVVAEAEALQRPAGRDPGRRGLRGHAARRSVDRARRSAQRHGGSGEEGRPGRTRSSCGSARCGGARGRVELLHDAPVQWVTRVDVLEREVAGLPCVDGMVELDLKPFEIVTLKFVLRGRSRSTPRRARLSSPPTSRRPLAGETRSAQAGMYSGRRRSNLPGISQAPEPLE